jgi:hypothetical protein
LVSFGSLNIFSTWSITQLLSSISGNYVSELAKLPYADSEFLGRSRNKMALFKAGLRTISIYAI